MLETFSSNSLVSSCSVRPNNLQSQHEMRAYQRAWLPPQMSSKHVMLNGGSTLSPQANEPRLS